VPAALGRALGLGSEWKGEAQAARKEARESEDSDEAEGEQCQNSECSEAPVNRESCEHVGCPWQPVYNYEGNVRARFCDQHKLQDMLPIKSKRCEHSGCAQKAIFKVKGPYADHLGQFCARHCPTQVRHELTRKKIPLPNGTAIPLPAASQISRPVGHASEARYVHTTGESFVRSHFSSLEHNNRNKSEQESSAAKPGTPTQVWEEVSRKETTLHTGIQSSRLAGHASPLPTASQCNRPAGHASQTRSAAASEESFVYLSI